MYNKKRVVSDKIYPFSLYVLDPSDVFYINKEGAAHLFFKEKTSDYHSFNVNKEILKYF